MHDRKYQKNPGYRNEVGNVLEAEGEHSGSVLRVTGEPPCKIAQTVRCSGGSFFLEPPLMRVIGTGNNQRREIEI
jgi:hypothetical protein